MKNPAALLLPALLGLLVLAGCSSRAQQTPPPPAPTPVRVAAVTPPARPPALQTSGRLAPRDQATLSFKVGGVVDRLLVDTGDEVRAGQLLARLDLAEIDAQVRQAESQVTRARRDADRLAVLFRDSVATLEQLEHARTALEVAQARLEIARFNRRHAEIHAPADGRILQRYVDAHELVAPGAPVLRLGTTDGWVVRAGLADRDVVRLHPGDPVDLHFDALPGQAFHGRITEIAGAADPLTGTFDVEVTVDDPDGRLRAGFIAHLRLFPSQGEAYPLIPVEALVEAKADSGVVFVLDEGGDRVRRRTVRIAHLAGDSLAVAGGLDAGAAVVTEGAAYLRDGDAVTVVR